MVDAFRFPPVGHRSIAGGYPHFGFAATPTSEVVKGLNEATLVVAMIETPLAVENVEKIAAVPGLDALLVGTNDLALEMGIPGQIEHERVVSAIDRVIAACGKHGKTAALGGVYAPEPLKRYIGRGLRMVLAGNDLGVLLKAAQEQAGFVRSLEAGK
jgi:2-keto-3-deoxy-L-rhamnonate aldolase RhmA